MENYQYLFCAMNVRRMTVFFFFFVQNLLIQDSEGYRKQYEDSIHEKVGSRNQEMMIIYILHEVALIIIF